MYEECGRVKDPVPAALRRDRGDAPLVWALFASGQITMRRVDGWQNPGALTHRPRRLTHPTMPPRSPRRSTKFATRPWAHEVGRDDDDEFRLLAFERLDPDWWKS
jgi:hypothetical protein